MDPSNPSFRRAGAMAPSALEGAWRLGLALPGCGGPIPQLRPDPGACLKCAELPPAAPAEAPIDARGALATLTTRTACRPCPGDANTSPQRSRWRCCTGTPSARTAATASSAAPPPRMARVTRESTSDWMSADCMSLENGRFRVGTFQALLVCPGVGPPFLRSTKPPGLWPGSGGALGLGVIVRPLGGDTAREEAASGGPRERWWPPCERSAVDDASVARRGGLTPRAAAVGTVAVAVAVWTLGPRRTLDDGRSNDGRCVGETFGPGAPFRCIT